MAYAPYLRGNKMERKNSGGMNIGTSSILVTFVLLCLVTFASLTYMSARSDYGLSEQTAARTAAYYDANRMAEIYMANIEGQLAKLADKCDGIEEYYDKIPETFSDNESVSIDASNDRVLINYSVAVTESQNLLVSLAAKYPSENDGMLITVEKWQTQTNSEYIENLKGNGFAENGSGLLF